MNTQQKNMIIIWLIALIIILIGAFQPIQPPHTYYINEIIHFSSFAILSFLIPKFIKNIHVLIFSLVGVIAIITGIEVLQSYTPTRMGSFPDFLAGTIGATIGMLIGYMTTKRA
jgi:VanZ family protein